MYKFCMSQLIELFILEKALQDSELSFEMIHEKLLLKSFVLIDQLREGKV